MLCFPSLAFLGGSVGAGEWVVLFVVILIVVGPKRLPEVARKLGRTMEMFRRAADEFKDQLMNMDQPSSSDSYSSHPDTSYDGDGVPSDPAESYNDDNPYPDTADYPGNEDHVAEWSAGSSDVPAESQGVTGAQSETSETPEVSEASETPTERTT
jgi:TatA/E family protein of Tat protein translocase